MRREERLSAVMKCISICRPWAAADSHPTLPLSGGGPQSAPSPCQGEGSPVHPPPLRGRAGVGVNAANSASPQKTTAPQHPARSAEPTLPPPPPPSHRQRAPDPHRGRQRPPACAPTTAPANAPSPSRHRVRRSSLAPCAAAKGAAVTRAAQRRAGQAEGDAMTARTSRYPVPIGALPLRRSPARRRDLKRDCQLGALKLTLPLRPLSRRFSPTRFIRRHAMQPLRSSQSRRPINAVR